MMKKFLILIVGIWMSLLSVGQDTTDFYSQIKNFNLVSIFSPDSFLTEGPEVDKQKVKRAEPFGFIDTNYTRFYIHFISAIKNKNNSYEYNITGKTKVKNNICDFRGRITFEKAKLYIDPEFPEIKQGFALGQILFYEDSTQTGSGFIKGKLKTFFYLDKKGKLKYNSLMWDADGFSNNQYVCTWTSYKTRKSKKCNWGDYRIPESGDFDIGAGEFSPADKYLKNGWQSYRDAYFRDPDKKNDKALQEEEKKWWIKK